MLLHAHLYIRYMEVVMALVTQTQMDITQRRSLENAAAESARNAAMIDYVAMMADVDIPTGENMETVEQPATTGEGA